MKRTPEQLKARCDAAFQRKLQWYALCSEAYWYAAPGMDPYFSGPDTMAGQWTAGIPRHDHLLDSTLARAATKLANRIILEMFPPGRRWAELSAGPLFVQQDPSELRRTLLVEQVRNRIFAAIQASNFTLAANALSFDGVISGTGLMKVGRSADSATLIELEAVNQAGVAFERGPMGALWAYHRKMDVSREELEVLWPEAKAPPWTDDDRGREPRRHPVLEATYYDPETGWWHYAVMAAEGGVDAPLLFERRYAVCPWVCWRYMLLAGEVQGRSPVMAALPDARTTQEGVRIELEAASIRSTGAYTYKSDTVFNPNTVSFEGIPFIPVGDNSSANPTIRPMELSGDVQLGRMVLEDQRASIRETLLDLALPEPAGPVRSATEIIERQRQAQQALGIPFLRLAEEVGRPILRAVAYLLAEAGELPELEGIGGTITDPDTGREVPAPLMLDGTDVAVEFSSPMVQAQRLTDAQALVQWAETAQVAAGPEAFAAGARVEAIPAKLGELMNVDAELLRDPDESAQRMQQMQQAAAPQATAAGPAPPEGMAP